MSSERRLVLDMNDSTGYTQDFWYATLGTLLLPRELADALADASEQVLVAALPRQPERRRRAPCAQ